MTADAFGELLRRHRHARRLTQAELAEQAGLSERAISDLERGLKAPQRGTLHLLIEALGLAPDAVESFEVAARSRLQTPEQIEDSTVRHNLPAALTSFVGREDEIVRLRQLLDPLAPGAQTVRLVTLTGPGGIGKTRLGLATASEMAGTFTDGVVFVPLAPVRDPNMVQTAIASSLGLRDDGLRPVSDLIHDYLARKRLLLILDNFEQVADAALLLPRLLTAASGLQVLVTSRAVLHVSGEHEFPVAPLALPDQTRHSTPDELAEVASVRLFVQRARAAQPHFSLTEDNVAAVTQVCLYLDGVPLAIELAAARARVLPPDVLLDRLTRDSQQRGVHLLTGGARDMPLRQQTLRATIDWSYDLLSPAEQAVFRCMGVFVGGCTLQDAEDILRTLAFVLTLTGADLLPHVEGLVDKSLLRPEHIGAPRFRMLETVREYAMEQLQERGEAAEMRRAHAAGYLALAERAESRLFSSEAGLWSDRLAAEHDNLRAALHWALENDDPDMAVRLTGALWYFWWVRGHLREGGQWLDRALAGWRRPDSRNRTDGAAVQRQETAALAKALTGAGVLAHYRAEYGLASALCGEALAISRRLDDPTRIAAALDGLALVARAGGSYAAARAMYREATDILERLGDTWGLSYTLRYLATTLWVESDYPAARPVAERALALARELRDQQGTTSALTVLSFVLQCQGDAPAAEALARQALSLLEGFGDRRGTARAHWALANAVAFDGRLDESFANYRAALEISHAISDRWFIPFCLIGLAERAVQYHHPQQAVRLLAAISVLEGGGDVPCTRAQLDRTSAAARAVLDESVWNASWQAGRQLTLDEAVDEALAIGVGDR